MTNEKRPRTETNVENEKLVRQTIRKHDAELLAISREANKDALTDEAIVNICKVHVYDFMYKRFGTYDVAKNKFGNNIDFQAFDRNNGGMSKEVLRLDCFALPTGDSFEDPFSYFNFGVVINVKHLVDQWSKEFFGIAVRVAESESGERSVYFNIGKDAVNYAYKMKPIRIWYYRNDKYPYATPLSTEELEYDIQEVMKVHAYGYDFSRDSY